MMAIRFKAFKAEYYDEKAFESAAEAILDQTERDFRSKFGQSVDGWEHRVAFRGRRDMTGQHARLVYGTNDDIYTFVSKGTKPHEIKPKKKGGRLRFQKGHRAKTRRGSLQSGSGGRSGEAVFAGKVKHPGSEPRDFDKTVVKQVQPKFEGYVREEIEKASRKRKGTL